MRVAVVAHGVPNPTSSGGALTPWSVIEHLRREGHIVTAVCLADRTYRDAAIDDLETRVRGLEQPGVRVELVGTPEEVTRPRPSLEAIFPALGRSGEVAEVLDAAAPDAIFAYSWEGAAATHGYRGAPRLAAVGDPIHLPEYYRLRSELSPSGRTLRRVASVARLFRVAPAAMVALLRECDASGAFAAHHAAWLRRKGVVGCEYLRTPVPDPQEVLPRATAVSASGPRRLRLLLVGHLRGTVTLNGLRIFARDVLPALDRHLSSDAFEVRIVGGYEPPPDLRRAFERPSIRFLGHLEPADEEFRQADALVVSNSIPLGIRVRIVTGFAHGCCIVTHEANQRGIPELQDRVNALVCRSGRSLAAGLVRALEDGDVRADLQRGARMTYEQAFSLPVAAGRIERILERLANAKGG